MLTEPIGTMRGDVCSPTAVSKLLCCAVGQLQLSESLQIRGLNLKQVELRSEHVEVDIG